MPKPGDDVLIMGLNGKVGQAAAQIAAWKGARVFGVVRREEPHAGFACSKVEVINSAAVDPRVVFGVALVSAAASIIVAHNHPSGSLEPSDADKSLTRRLRQAGEMIGVKVLDHLILSRTDAYSFAEHGLL